MNTAISSDMADLHTHILPGLDDGARTAQDAVQLLKLQAEEGVTAVALTPHFSFGRCGVDVFCEQRQKAFERLQGAAAGLPGCPRLLLGAEVAFSPRVLDEDMRPLCLGGGDAMLLELPWHACPPQAGDVLFELKLAGITPVLAHVERFSYLLSDPALLASFIQAGALAQVNASSLLGGGWRRQVLHLIEDELVHIIASDTHSVAERPPNLAQGLRVVAKKLGQETAQAMRRQAAALVEMC